MMNSIDFSNKFTKTEKVLIKKLMDIWRDEDFVFGIINSLKDDIERQAVIDFIDSKDCVDSDTLNLLSLYIANERNI